MKQIIYKISLTGDKFMLELYLKQPQFSYSALGPFTRYFERIQKIRETGNLKYLYRKKIRQSLFSSWYCIFV